MSYSGFLIKVGDYIIPANKYIKAESYKSGRYLQDLDSTRNANGELLRTVLDHVPLKAEFETPALLTNAEVSELFRNISKNYIIAKERKSLVTMYVPEMDNYVTQEMYMPDPEFTIYTASNRVIKYQPIRLAFIGY